MQFSFIRQRIFWLGTILTLGFTSLFFAWELNLLSSYGLNGPPRPRAGTMEFTFAVLLILLLSVNTGLILWHRKFSTCPIGTRRATGAAAGIGVFALICPVCIAFPVGLLGASFTLTVMSPFIPLLQVIAVILLGASLLLLLPRK